MAAISNLFMEEELKRMDELVYQARQHGHSTLARKGVLQGDSDYLTLLVDAADDWFANQPKPSSSDRDVQIYHHARYTKNRTEGGQAASTLR